MTFRRNLLLWIASWLMRLLMQGIGRTCRVQFVFGQHVIDNLLKNRRPVIFSFWHNRIFYSSYYLYRHLFKKGVHLTVLISKSDDGEIIARVVGLWGGDLARGSSSRGGKEALMILNNALKKKNSSIVTTPDGPRGPVYEFQAGTILLSQFTQSEIVPITFSADRYWTLRSWDKFIIPKPFAKIAVSFGEPYIVPRKLSEEEKELQRQKMQSAMLEQNREVDEFIAQKSSKKKD